MRTQSLAVAVGLALGVAAAAMGLAAPGARAEEDASYLVAGFGLYDAIQNDNQALDYRLEYRHGAGLWLFKPWIGIEGTSDGAFSGLGGILADVPFGQRIVVTPSIGVGAYAEGDGKDLGHTVQFRSQIEATYRLDNRARLGIAFSHISNAGLGDTNPGTEVITIYYALPLTGLIGN